ncbi:type IV secretion system DNA-binding domain-containing protein, partial [Patescibacteria group bacterium]
MNNNNDITLFAETNFRNEQKRFGIKRDDRRRHMYLIGKTGMGKSTMLENMIISDIKAGNGVAVVDPHGDLVEKVLEYIPSNRLDDVIYFNPADMEYPIGFNPLESLDIGHKHLVASGLIGIFKKLWADTWGPRLEYVLRNAVLALMDNEGTTLLGIMRILVDKSYRKKMISNIKDPVVKSFWVDEYSKYPDKFQAEAINPIQNKVGQFLSNFLIRNVVGQVKSTFDMRDIMDNQKILLMNLSKGRIGEDTSSLLGAMMITKIQLAVMDRIDMKEDKRKDFYLYVDEFQNFATESFANILSEARKYRLNLIVAHQYIEQLDETVQAAVFGNVGTIVTFRIGAQDAEELVKEFTPTFLEEDLVNIKKWDCYMKLMVDGISTDPFSATGLPPLMQNEITNNKENIINLSRERYATKREDMEAKIAEWSGMDMNENKIVNNRKLTEVDNTSTKKVNKDNDKIDSEESADDKEPLAEGEFLAVCANCEEKIRLNFEPDGKRPVFCKKCLKKIRKGTIVFNPLLASSKADKEVISTKNELNDTNLEEKEISLSDIKVEKKEENEVSIFQAMKNGPVNFRGQKMREE